MLRARTLSETRGFLKALVELNSDRLLGFIALTGAHGFGSDCHDGRLALHCALRWYLGSPDSRRGTDPAVLVRAVAIDIYRFAVNTLTNYANELAGTEIDFPLVEVKL